MLPSKYRLTKNKDFARVAKLGQAFFGPELGIKWIKNNLLYSRFGISISLKIDKKAVVRNRIKRILRAILKENLSKISKGFDFLILTKPKIKELEYQEIKRKLLLILEKSKLTENK